MSRNLRKISIVLLFGIAIFLLGWFIGPSGSVTGIEFSPDRFAHRSFRYYVWCGIQITPMRTREFRSHVDIYIRENGYAPYSKTETPRWSFVKGFAPATRGWHGEAKSMCQSLGCWSSQDDYWVQWSNEHPDLAQIVWPQVVTWARNDQYREIAELFRGQNLEKADSPDDLRRMIDAAEKQFAPYR